MNKLIKVLVIVIILAGAFIVRKQNFSQVPFPGDSLDEYSNSWVGLSLIRVGVPVGGLGVGGYEHTRYEYINVDRIFQSGIYTSPIKINWPWFDHPPMMGIITGGFAYLNGARTFGDIELVVIRKPMLVMGTLSVLLVIVLGWMLFNFKSGVMAGIIYATSPLIVIGSRMVQAENGLIPLFLMAIIFLVKFDRIKSYKYLFFAVLFAGLALTFKLSAIAIFLTILIIVTNKDRLIAMALYLPFLALFPLYGSVYDWKTFLNVFGANSERVYGIGPQGFYELITKTRITNLKFLSDGIILSGWLAFASLMNKFKEFNFLIAPVGAYLVVYFILGSYPHGWYALPIWPFIFLALGKIVSDAVFAGGNKFFAMVLLVVPLGLIVSKLFPGEAFNVLAGGWRWGIGAGLFGMLYFGIHPINNRKVNLVLNLIVLLVFSSVILGNIVYLQTINVDYWYKIN